MPPKKSSAQNKPAAKVTAPATTKFSPDIEAKLAKFPAAKQKNRRILLKRYEQGRTSQWQDRQLKDDGLIDAPAGAEPVDGIDICFTQEALAERMRLHYLNPDGSNQLKITITKQMIGQWQKGRQLGDKQILPPGPLPLAQRKWSLNAYLAWFDATLWHKHKKDATQKNTSAAVEMSLPEMREREERAKIEFDNWKRIREMGGYVAMPVAERVAAGFSRQYHDLWKTRNEKSMVEAFKVKMQALQVTPEIIATLIDFLIAEHQKFTDAVELACEKFAGELSEKLKAEASHALP